MRRRAQVGAWLALSFLGAGNVWAFPQEPEKQEKSAEAKKSREMRQEQKSNAEAGTTEEDKDTSGTLHHSATRLGERYLLDQKQIWMSPARLRWQDANWLLPLGGVSAGL
ncbi:MAG: hypothetical protein WBL63_08970, partial [Candidatus Acidiferrum sp.]